MFGRNPDQYKNGVFTWFIGSVEDINDPEGLNRVKVRAYGYYACHISIYKRKWW